MHWIITLAIVVWTTVMGSRVSMGNWDTFVLTGWLTWPLILCSVLAYWKHRDQQTAFWRLKYFSDFLLLGAYIPLAIGILYFNVLLDERLDNEAKTFGQNLLFVGFYTVKLWGGTAISVFLFYIASKFMLKRPN